MYNQDNQGEEHGPVIRDAYRESGEYRNSDGEEINGIPVSEYMTFIENNESRYIEIFKKNEKKKWFLSMNWAAFFFSVYWMFYRKMYIEGIIYMLITTVLSVCVTAGVLFGLSGEIAKLYESQDESTKISETYDSSYYEEYYKRYKEERQLKNKVLFYSIIPFAVLSVVFGLLADMLYRQHILRNIKHGGGGTSKWSVLAAFPIVWISNKISETVAALIIAQILEKIPNI